MYPQIRGELTWTFQQTDAKKQNYSGVKYGNGKNITERLNG